MTDDASIGKAVQKVEQRLNGRDLNCVINNAGMTTKLKFSDINEKDMMETYRQNVIGPWKVTKVDFHHVRADRFDHSTGSRRSYLYWRRQRCSSSSATSNNRPW